MTRISFSAGLSNFFGEYSGVELGDQYRIEIKNDQELIPRNSISLVV